jgi:hypothetical protein
MRCGIHHTPSVQRTPSQTRHVGFRPGLINKYDPSHVNIRVVGNPRVTKPLHIGAFSFAGPQRFFYTDTPIASARCG